MRTDNANSDRSSAETSAAETPIQPPKSPAETAKAVAKAGVGEAAYLERQAQLAQQAIARTLSDAAALAKQSVDPRKWAQTHPWATLGATLVAGFAAAAIAVPSKEEQALRKLAAMERALHPEPKHHNGNGSTAREHPPEHKSLGRVLVGELLGALRPVVVSLLTAELTASTTKAAADDDPASADVPPSSDPTS